ncbi:hypothetical protein PVAP13_7KG203910 [Panicum virgatum]|uniref:Uncharacterized protein n=1 Tax=Panicum virgatum TaxID=38727 RepID=A0A8T0QGG5_PANVG|nr:hypothetical protein PVAP13_7KG203910 [Panicum virgatum]
MPGPFPAEIRAAPLSSPLPPLPPFLLPPVSLIVFFFPATHSGGSSTSSGSARVSSAASTTARARASLSPSRERDPWRPPYASSPASTPPRPRRPAKVQLDLLGLHLCSAAAARSAGSRSGLPLHLLVPAHPVLTLLRHPPPRARSVGASPWPDHTASAAPSPPPRQSRWARRSSPSPPPSSGGLPLNKSDLNHRRSGLASRSPWCARRKLQQAGEWGTEFELLDSACFYITFFFPLDSFLRWNLLLLQIWCGGDDCREEVYTMFVCLDCSKACTLLIKSS